MNNSITGIVIPYFKNGMLNYNYLKKKFRTNSYIENYNSVLNWNCQNIYLGNKNQKFHGYSYIL